MQAVILSAGQGRRLLPYTENMPKCLLTINGKSILEWQLNNLKACGVSKITVVVGFGAEKVEKEIERKFSPEEVQTLYNPYYSTSDNLVSCWVARSKMESDFVLLNGDTVFEKALLEKSLQTSTQPITVTIDQKETYDLDDMKVITENGLLCRVGKKIPLEEVKGESIGMHIFKGKGPDLFKQALEDSINNKQANKLWYLSVIDELSRKVPVGTCCIQGLQWSEIDYPEDLELARKDLVLNKETQSCETYPNSMELN